MNMVMCTTTRAKRYKIITINAIFLLTKFLPPSPHPHTPLSIFLKGVSFYFQLPHTSLSTKTVSYRVNCHYSFPNRIPFEDQECSEYPCVQVCCQRLLILLNALFPEWLFMYVITASRSLRAVRSSRSLSFSLV